MPKTGRHTGKSPLTVHSHCFGFTYPETKAYGMPPQTNACYACHQDKTLDELQKDLDNWGQVEWVKMEIPQLLMVTGYGLRLSSTGISQLTEKIKVQTK